jgi:hypothetical protein
MVARRGQGGHDAAVVPARPSPAIDRRVLCVLCVLCVLAGLAAALLAGCGSGASATPLAPTAPAPGALAGGVVPATPRPVPIGSGSALRPTADTVPSPRFPCRRPAAGSLARHDAIHLELFAAGRVVIVPPGIGVGRPHRRSGAFVTGGPCVTALRTSEPTGVIELSPGTRATLGDLFAVWGRPLTDTRLLGFRGRVRAWVDGVRWTDPVRSIPLRPRRQIVLVTGPDVPVHATYAFPPAGVTHLRP